MSAWAATPVVLLGLLIPGATVQAQDTSAQLPYHFEFGQTLRVTDNIRLNRDSLGTTTAAETRGRAEYRFEDSIQSLELGAGGVLRVLDDPVLGSDTSLSDADAAIRYLREGANARLSLQSRFVRRDLAFDNPLSGDGLTQEDLSTSTGQRDDISHRLVFATGLSSAFGLTFDLGQIDRRYRDTDDSDLFDNKTQSGTLGGIFRLNDTTSAQLDLFRSRYEAEDSSGSIRDTRRIVFGVDHVFSETTTLQVDLGHAVVEESFTALPGAEERESGVIGTVAIARERRNGLVSARLDSNVTAVGRRSTFVVTRDYVLPTGALSFSLGVLDGSTTDPRAIGSLTYSKEWLSSRFRAEVNRSGAVSDTDSVVTETTRWTLGYDYAVSPLTNLSLDLRHASIQETGSNADPDRSRSSLDLSMTRDLGNEWDLVAGYQFRRSGRDDTGSAHSNALFFTLNREFGTQN